jgi:arginine exporter protein ArgO
LLIIAIVLGLAVLALSRPWIGATVAAVGLIGVVYVARMPTRPRAD